jgi:hypothetical protein
MLLSCGVAFSQNAPPNTQKFAALYSLKKGQRIRVEKSDGSVITGKLRAVKDDSLLFSAGSTQVITISISELQSLWVRASAAKEGGKAGAILGAIPGAIAGSSLAGLANRADEMYSVGLNFPRFIGGIMGGIAGAAGGAAIGSLIGATIPHWQRVYP